jgi:hypothetical protein
MKHTTFRRIVATTAFIGAGVAVSLFAFYKITGIWFDEVSWLDIPVVIWIYPGSFFLMAIPQRGSEGMLFDGIIIMISIIANIAAYAALAAMITGICAAVRGGITRPETRKV